MNKYYRSVKYRITHYISNNRLYKEIERKIIGNITHIETDEPVIALTFDGGPDSKWTPQVLELLLKYKVPATFFVIGKYAHRHGDIIKEIAARGHVIGNHSWDHPSFPLLSKKDIKWQVKECSKIIGGYDVKLFRPPFGHLDKKTLTELYRLNRKVITWNVHPFDWQDRDPEWMVDNMIESIRPGSIVLLHDAVCDQRFKSRENMLIALRMFLEEHHCKFKFLTIPELLRKGKTIKENWIRLPNMDFLNSYERVI